MRAYYQRRAAEYEAIYDRPERQADLAVLRARVAACCAGRDALELACGTGWWTEVAASGASSILATDFNPAPLEIARGKAYACPVRFAQMDAYAPQPGAGNFDCGYAMFWWSHVPRARLADFLRDFTACLAPGSLLLFVDNRYVAGSSTPIARTDDAGDSHQQRTLADGSRHEVLKNFPHAQEIRAALEPFCTRIEVTELTYYWLAAARTR